jgi:hypothetical protein
MFSLHQAFGEVCSSFSCASISGGLLTQTCIYQEGSTYDLSICSDEYYYYCPPNLNNTVCTLPPTVSDINISYPGEPCTYDRNCLNSVCNSGTCQGVGLNAQCVDSSQCSPGFYCNNTCKNLAELDYSCLNQYKQNDDSLCQYKLACHNGLCTKLSSLPSGTVVETCNNNINLMCVSSYCITNSSNINICVDKTQTNGTVPKQCTYNGDCLVGSGNMIYSTICSCGYNPYANSYCGLASGDEDFVNLVSLMNQWLTSTNVTKCNTKRRLEPACINKYASQNLAINLTYFYQNYINYPNIQENDQCIKTIYTSDYWNAYQAYISQFTPKPKSSHALVLAIVPFLYLL